MKVFFKSVMLFAIGLFTASIVYPFLHELGHFSASAVCGVTVAELALFPLPSVLCCNNDWNTATVIFVGLSGIILPYLLTVMPPPKDFWLWYSWLVIKGITILSLIISFISVIMYFIGKPLPNDDMTQLLGFTSDYAAFYLIGFIVLAVISVLQIIKTKPFKRCCKEFELQKSE